MRNKTVALGIGSNLNQATAQPIGQPISQPISYLRQALNEVKKSSLFEVLKVASIYESEAQLLENARPDWNKNYLNSVILCRVLDSVSAEDLLSEVKSIEVKMGRVHSEKWAPRIIDIDVLYWDSETCKTDYKSEKINIPHAELSARPFALLPLLEVWPEIKLQINLQLPAWSKAYIEKKPFNTKKSKKYFWPQLVGILNITKDSFSDGGKFLTADRLQQQYHKLVQQGADIIDIGAESTRPEALFISEQQEYENLNWALSELNPGVPISLDCRRAQVAERILETHPIAYLNDVTGFADLKMKSLLQKSELPAFVMHSLSVPPSSDLTLTAGKNPCCELLAWWKIRSSELLDFGISSEQLIFDPGIGFGKNKLQNLYILRNLNLLASIKNPMVMAHSRKSFLSLFSDPAGEQRAAEQRDFETALVTRDLNLAYVQYLRVHDIESQKIALRN